MEQKFYKCSHCGKIVALVKESGVPVMCCGTKMEEIIPGTSDGAQEKHSPVYNVDGETVTVSVGETEHPMTPDHYIDWVCVETEDGFQFKKLKPNTSPKISFSLSKGDKVKSVYAFCNQHSLWKA
jgi:superoxide reductase